MFRVCIILLGALILNCNLVTATSTGGNVSLTQNNNQPIIDISRIKYTRNTNRISIKNAQQKSHKQDISFKKIYAIYENYVLQAAQQAITEWLTNGKSCVVQDFAFRTAEGHTIILKPTTESRNLLSPRIALQRKRRLIKIEWELKVVKMITKTMLKRSTNNAVITTNRDFQIANTPQSIGYTTFVLKRSDI